MILRPSQAGTANMAAIPWLFAFVVLGCCVVHNGVSARKNLCPSSCSCLLGNMVDCSKRGLIEVPKDIPSWATVLDLQSNGITELTVDAFDGLHNLKNLDLSNNDIRFINGTFFKDLTSIDVLKMNYNKLTEIPIFSKNSSLTDLSLAHNSINTLNPEAFEMMPNLRKLDLNYNDIMDLPVGTFLGKSKLEDLFMTNNRIVSLDLGTFDNLTSLQWLKLNKNKLMEIQKNQFGNLTTLKTLELTRNRIQKIEGLAFSELKHLRALKLKRNVIHNLMDGAFYGLDKVEILQLDYNNLTTIKKGWLYGLDSVKQLTLSHNHLATIEPDCWGFCKYLKKLDLNHNKISSVAGRTFAQLVTLQDLLLNHNHISRIDDGAFKELTALTTLEMNNNQISGAIEDSNAAFEGLKKLSHLGLGSNHILSITQGAFKGLEKLRQLHVQGNAITSIEDNPFRDLDIHDFAFNSTNLLCDCQLAWFPGWLRKSGFESTVHAICNHPVYLKGRSIFDVQYKDFKCIKLSRPLIMEIPKSQIALKEDNVTLRCVAKVPGGFVPTFQWKKDNLLLTDAHVTTDFVEDGDAKSYTSQLFLRRVQDDANGLYQCIVTNNFGSAYSDKAEISVHVFPKFTKVPKDVTVRVGSTAKLECFATGQPQPVVAWSKDGGLDFPAARSRRMHVMPSDDTFFITNTRTEDDGVYTCTAQNAAGIIVTNATLTVLEKPSFSRPMDAEKIGHLGETVVLECRAYGKPKPKLKWSKDNKELVFTDRHFTTGDDQLLIIVDTKPVDKGTYTCKISNTLGEQKGNTELKLMTEGGYVGEGQVFLDDESTTTGIIIIAVVCCVVGTSLVWVIIIYQTRKRHELYSSTPTDETTLPCEVPSSGYTSSDKEGSFTQAPPITMFNYQYQDCQMKESGYESSSGKFRPNGWTRPTAIFPSDVDEDEHIHSRPLSDSNGHQSTGNSLSSLPRSETDTISSSHSTSSTSGHHMLRTFHPQLTNHDRCLQTPSEPCDCCETPSVVGTNSRVLSLHKTPSACSIPSSRSSGSLTRPDGGVASLCSSCRTIGHRTGRGVCDCPRGVSPARHGSSSPSTHVHITSNPLENVPTSIDSTKEAKSSQTAPNGVCPCTNNQSQHAVVNSNHTSANQVPFKKRPSPSNIPGPKNSMTRAKQNTHVDV